MRYRLISVRKDFIMFLIGASFLLCLLVAAVAFCLAEKIYVAIPVVLIAIIPEILIVFFLGLSIKIIEFHENKIIYIPLLTPWKKTMVSYCAIEKIRIITDPTLCETGIKNLEYYEFLFPRTKQPTFDPYRLERTSKNDGIIKDLFEGRIPIVEDPTPLHFREYPMCDDLKQ